MRQNPPVNVPASTATESTLAGNPTKIRAEEVRDKNGDIIGYELVTSKLKVDDEAKGVVLLQLAEHGRIGAAARAAGVTAGTVKKHARNDKEFGEACAEAIDIYKDRLLKHQQDLVFKGTKKMHYDRQGKLVSEETVYPIRLIELELKRHHPEYRDKQEVDVNHRGGVLVAPSAVPSIEDWAEKYGRKTDNSEDRVSGEIIEGTATEE